MHVTNGRAREPIAGRARESTTSSPSASARALADERGSPTAMTAAVAAAAAAATRTLLSNVHAHRAAFVHGTVELRDRVGRFSLALHRNEGKTPRAAGLTVHHDVEVGD